MPSLLSVGTVLRTRYKITRVIFQEKLTNVYYVNDLHISSKSWVLKEMQMVAVETQDKSKIIENFNHEALNLSYLSHPDLATVLDFFQEGMNLYIIREYINGLDLDSLMKKNQKPFSEAEVVPWALQIAELLSFLHSRKLPAIFFREFHMKNIIRQANGGIKLIDLGLAKVFQTGHDEESLKRLGSMEYASPEQYSEEGAFDGRSLVYSLGAFMYHSLTSVNPASSPFDLKPVNILNPAVSPKTMSIVNRATEIKPGKRYQSLNEMKKELHNSLKSPRKISKPARDSRPDPVNKDETGDRENKLLNWILGILIIIGLGILIYFLFLEG